MWGSLHRGEGGHAPSPDCAPPRQPTAPSAAPGHLSEQKAAPATGIGEGGRIEGEKPPSPPRLTSCGAAVARGSGGGGKGKLPPARQAGCVARSALSPSGDWGGEGGCFLAV